MGQLALDHLRHASLLQHQQHPARRLRQWSSVEIDELRSVEAERAEIHAIFVDGGAVALHLLDKGDQRGAEGNDVGEPGAAQNRRAHLKEVFGGGVDIFDPKPFANDEERMRQGAEHGFWRYQRRQG